MKAMKYILKTERGHSLIEIIIGINIFAILFLASMNFCMSLLARYRFSMARNDMNIEGVFALAYIENEIEESIEVYRSKDIIGLDERYPNNLGFLLRRAPSVGSTKSGDRFIFYHYDQGSLYRVAGKSFSPNSEIGSINLGEKFWRNLGKNMVLEDIADYRIDPYSYDDGMVRLDFQIERNESKLGFKRDIFTRYLGYE